MMLWPRTIVTSLAVAVPTAAIITVGVEWLRGQDRALALERVVRSQLNDAVRERCEADPNWFLTGPLEGRPRRGEPVIDPNNPDALPPRPKVTEQPFELFAFDEQFRGSSSAAPRFPNDFRRGLQQQSAAVFGSFDEGGRGAQMAVATGWIGSPCMYFLGRMRVAPGQTATRVKMFAVLFALVFAGAWLAQAHLAARARRLSSDVRAAIKEGYASVAPDKLKDELSQVTFMYNDTATELHQRKTRIDDQDEALRRYVLSSVSEVAPPLARVERDLGELSKAVTGEAARSRVHRALTTAHYAASRLENLGVAARLRMSGPLGRDKVDLRAVLERVADRDLPLAIAAGVTMTLSAPSQPVWVEADEPLIERAIGNLVENAIIYNTAGGHVGMTLQPDAARGFSLKITDTGRSVSDEELKGLTAVRRFRGDESQNRRENAPGLGIALAREVTDRFGMLLELRRPAASGFEAEITKRV